MSKVLTVGTFDGNELSDSGFETLQQMFKELGYYVGNLGEGSDTFILYVAKKPLTPEELKADFPEFFAKEEKAESVQPEQPSLMHEVVNRVLKESKHA